MLTLILRTKMANNGPSGLPIMSMKDCERIAIEKVDVNPNTADKDAQRPLFSGWCAHQGREGVLNRLLERVDVDSDLRTQIAKDLFSGLPTTGMRSC